MLSNSIICDHAALVRLLLADGFTPNTIKSGTNSLLYLAAGNGSIDVLRLLLEAGADPNSGDDLGNTPFRAATTNGKLACARELIPRTDLRIFSASGHNVLHGSIISNQPEIFKLLLPTLRTTSTCAPSRDALRLTLAVLTTTRHCISHVRVDITPW